MLLILQKFIWDNIYGLVTFPYWWYSRGLKEVFFILTHSIKRADERLGVGLWLGNLFNPMYGQRDWQGRVISFFMRVVQIIARSFVFVIWILIVLVLFVLWLAILPLAVYGVVQSVLGILS